MQAIRSGTFKGAALGARSPSRPQKALTGKLVTFLEKIAYPATFKGY